MSFARRSRFRRAEVTAIKLTERDRQIIHCVARHRFLDSRQIIQLLGGSNHILRRLQLLYHHGYLERPRAQLDYYHKSGSRPIVYGLGNKGGTLLKAELGNPKISWGEKNRAVGRIYLEHAILVSEVMVALELACRTRPDVQLIRGEELKRGKPFKWKVTLKTGLQIGVMPDQVFALEFQDSSDQSQRILYFLEADRGTMPVIRKSLEQTSLYRKLLAYEATWAQNIHWSMFGFHRMRVLFVTKSPERVSSLLEACAKLESGHGLFLVEDQTILEQQDKLLSADWQIGRIGINGTLLS